MAFALYKLPKSKKKRYIVLGFLCLVRNVLNLTLLLPGCQTNNYSWGVVFRTQSYFQLIWTPFWTRGTIFEHLIVKVVHQWSCRRRKIAITQANLRVPSIFFLLHDHWWTPLTINCSKIVPRVQKGVQISWK